MADGDPEMLASAVRSLFRRSLSRPFETALTGLASGVTEPAEPAGEAATTEEPIRTGWPASRLALVHQLWGEGFIFPGGELETLRLTRPLGISPAATLLIVGVGSGGPAICVARNLGVWVTGVESDPALRTAAQAQVIRAHLTKKISIKAWDPNNPVFVAKGHHHCVALEPFRGARPEPILDALARALRPGGQMVLTDLAAATPLDLANPTVRRWAELEQRDPYDVLTPVSVSRMLGRVGLDVRVAEDISQRHLEQAMLGWRVLLRDLGPKPSRQKAVSLIAEAELWLLRRRLIRNGQLRMMRWHAITGSAIA
jgi:SAM-dependent methyltransferase